MKEIGDKLKSSREEAGVTIDEVVEDLGLELNKIKHIENGNKEAFKDTYELKHYIKDYAKYLGLDYEKLTEEFDEFMFDYTSRIPIAQIQQASKEIEKNNKKITSPYTIPRKSNKKFKITIIMILFLLLLLIVGIITVISSLN